MSMVNNIKHIMLGTVLAMGLVACGGGGGGAAGGSQFVADASSGASADILRALFNPIASTTGTMVFDVTLPAATNNIPASGALSADMSFDSSWMTFAGFTVDANQIGSAVAAVDQGDTTGNTVVLAVTGVQAGAVGQISFDVTGAGNTAVIGFSDANYIDQNGHVVATVALASEGGTASN